MLKLPPNTNKIIRKNLDLLSPLSYDDSRRCVTTIDHNTSDQEVSATTSRYKSPRNSKIMTGIIQVSSPLKQMNEKNRSQTARSRFNINTSFDGETSHVFIERNRKTSISPKSIGIRINEQGKSVDLLKATTKRKHLENQYQLMENRVNYLLKENEKLKQKLEATNKKTKIIIENKERHIRQAQETNAKKYSLEKENLVKKKSVAKIRIDLKEKKQEMEQKLLYDRINKANRIKAIKFQNQKLRSEMKRNEEIQNNEKIYKVVLQEHKLETLLLERQARTKQEAKKRIEKRLNDEQIKADEISAKFKELEKLEQKLLIDLKHTHEVHVNKYNQMQMLYRQSSYSRSPTVKK